jgi:hypothetical protein
MMSDQPPPLPPPQQQLMMMMLMMRMMEAKPLPDEFLTMLVCILSKHYWWIVLGLLNKLCLGDHREKGHSSHPLLLLLLLLLLTVILMLVALLLLLLLLLSSAVGRVLLMQMHLNPLLL